jgi:hypothetical protein
MTSEQAFKREENNMKETYKSMSLHFPEGLIFTPGSTLTITQAKGEPIVDVTVYGGETGTRYENIPVEIEIADMTVRTLKVS